MININEEFDLLEESEEFLQFEKVEPKFSTRPDLHAFILLDKLVPNAEVDIISSAEHDEIWLEVDVKELEKVATAEDVLTLVRCGVMYDDDTESLHMFA